MKLESLHSTANSSRKLLEISYDGTQYPGWQSQRSLNGIQDIIEKKLYQIYQNQKIRVHSAGRTDAGVHALSMTAHFDSPDHLNISNEALLRIFTRQMPMDIHIHKISDVPFSFHARFSAIGKTYVYVLNCGEQNPFISRYSWHTPQITQVNLMRESLNQLTGEHDFRKLSCRRTANDHDTIRTLYHTDLIQKDELIILTFSGNGFLYKMVRFIVGLLYKIGAGKLSPKIIPSLFNPQLHTDPTFIAPPSGLFLKQVYYQIPEWNQTTCQQIPFLCF